MYIRKPFTIIVLLCALNGLALALVPHIEWTNRYNDSSSSHDYATDMAVDTNGDIYVTGYAKNSGTNNDFATIKYTSDGNTLWTKTYNRNGTSNDYALAMTMDANSNVIVAGYSKTTYSGYDGAIVKYDSAGTQLWARTYNSSGTSYDMFYDVTADAAGNIYAVGTANDDLLVIKYTPDGSAEWVRAFNGSGNGYDVLYKVAIDGSGNVYACGELSQSGTTQDCVVIKYSPDGTRQWIQTYNGAANRWDRLDAIAIDNAEDIYVTGSVETADDSNFITMKYSPAGQRRWISFYSAEDSSWDESYAIAVCSDGNIAVTGYSQGITSIDASTLKYDSQTGFQLWAAVYNGSEGSTDYTEAIATDNRGNIYVQGRSYGNGSMNYLTICYDSNGAMCLKANYNGPAGLSDTGSAMVLVNNNNLYVTGSSQASANNYDYLTIKYNTLILPPCPTPPQSDLTGDCKVDFADIEVLVDNWLVDLETSEVAGNFNSDNRIDFRDFAIMAEEWMTCNLTEQSACWE